MGLALTTDPMMTEGEIATRRIPVPPRPVPLAPRLDAATLEAHQVLLKSLGQDPLWHYYEVAREAAE